MIPLAEINAAAVAFQIPSETIEKDYVISWILFLLASSSLQKYFTFYGGTAIKRIYSSEHRFSEDIDFISTTCVSLELLMNELRILKDAQVHTN